VPQRNVSVRFTAEIQGFKAAMAEAAAATEKTKKATEDAGKTADTHLGKLVQSATKYKDAWEQTGAGLLGFGAAAVAGVGLAVKTYADFDRAMSSIDAATHETAGNMQLLRNAAVEAGADTAFSAQEAAQGIEELAKAGVSTKDILSGAFPEPCRLLRLVLWVLVSPRKSLLLPWCSLSCLVTRFLMLRICWRLVLVRRRVQSKTLAWRSTSRAWWPRLLV